MTIQNDEYGEQKIAFTTWNLSKRDAVAALLVLASGALSAFLTNNLWAIGGVPALVLTLFLGFTDED
jgi:hypothetical protein